MKRMIGLLMMVGLVVGVYGCGSEKKNPLSSSDIDMDEFFGSLVNEGMDESDYEVAELTTNGFINNGDIKTGTINNAQTSCNMGDFCHTVLWEFNLPNQKTVDIIVDGVDDITFYVLRYRNGSFTAILDSDESYESDEDDASSLSDYDDSSTFSKVLEKGTYFIAIGSYEREDSYRLAMIWY